METHTKKHILGFVGLAAVAAMTAVAFTIPTPDASAVESVATDVTYSVDVHEPASVTLPDDLDGAVFNKTPVSITAKYSETIKISYYLSYTDKSGNPVVEQLIRSLCPNSNNGICPEDAELLSPHSSAQFTSANYATGTDTFDLNFDDYGGYGTYTLHVVVTTTQSMAEDYATFKYAAGLLTDQGTDENGNPLIGIETNGDVGYTDIQVYDTNGNPLFVDENGNPTPYRVNTGPNSNTVATLPFDQYGISDGQYVIEATFYDFTGRAINVNTLKINYDGASKRPGVPDTGFLSFGNLNIAQADYWIIGLAILTAITGGAYYLTKRAKNRR